MDILETQFNRNAYYFDKNAARMYNFFLALAPDHLFAVAVLDDDVSGEINPAIFQHHAVSHFLCNVMNLMFMYCRLSVELEPF